MRLLVVACVIPSVAHADPRDIFGLPKPKEAPAADCGHARDLGCASATDPLDDVTPYALSTYLTAAYVLGLPVADATHVEVAHYALGAARDEQGVGFTGANGLETRWTIDGAPADNARYGGADTAVPLPFLAGFRAYAGGFSARDRVSTGGLVDAQLLEGGEHHVVDVRLWGTQSAAPRSRTLASGIYQLRRQYTDPAASPSLSLVASGPIAPLADALHARAWYAVGVAPQLTRTTLRWEAQRLVDANGDQLADLTAAGDRFTLDPVETTARKLDAWFVPVMARAGLARGPHALALSIVGQLTRDERDLANATAQAAAVVRDGYVGDAIATYTGTWTDTRVRAQLAWHRSALHEHARDPAAAKLPQFLSAYLPGTLAEDPALADACVATGGFSPCPIPFGYFASGGAGLLVDQTADRPTATLDVAHRLGQHVVRAGGTFEDTRLVLDQRYTGDELDRSLFAGHVDHASFHGSGTCVDLEFDGPCDYQSSSTLSYRTRSTAAYVEDTFHPIPTIAVDGGLRYELMWVGTRLHFSDQLAPRFGVAWDFLGGGRSRAFASLGRSFAYLPAGVGTYVLPGVRIVHDIEIAGIGNTRSLDTGAPLPIAPGLQPTTQDEATAGVEIGLARTVRLVGWMQAKRLRAMETTSDALANPTDGVTSADRESTTGAIELATTGKLALRVGYLWNRTVGSTTGMADPRQGAVLYNGSDFNADIANLWGRLPTDLAHRVFVEARRSGHLAGIPVALATRLTASSGRPRDVLSQSGEGVMEILPRGSYGRGALLTQANVELAARWHGVDLTLDVFDLFDRTSATNTDSVYTTQVVRPIDHGTAADLVFARSDSGAPLQRWTPFQYGTSFQAPIAVALGIRCSF